MSADYTNVVMVKTKRAATYLSYKMAEYLIHYLHYPRWYFSGPYNGDGLLDHGVLKWVVLNGGPDVLFVTGFSTCRDDANMALRAWANSLDRPCEVEWGLFSKSDLSSSIYYRCPYHIGGENFITIGEDPFWTDGTSIFQWVQANDILGFSENDTFRKIVWLLWKSTTINDKKLVVPRDMIISEHVIFNQMEKDWMVKE